jgi:hypothetical protein
VAQKSDRRICLFGKGVVAEKRITFRFIFLGAGYSTHKRFVLGGEECAAPFACKTLVSCKTLVAYYADGCSLVDKGQVGYGL